MTLKTHQKKRNSPKWNFLILGFVIILCTLMLHFGEYGTLDTASKNIALIPTLLGLVTIIVYILSRLVTKRYNWIATLIGIGLMLFISLPIFFGAVKYQ